MFEVVILSPSALGKTTCEQVCLWESGMLGQVSVHVTMVAWLFSVLPFVDCLTYLHHSPGSLTHKKCEHRLPA